MVNSKALLTRFYLFLLIVLIFRIPASAGEETVIDKIAKDFKPIPGYLVKEIDDEYIIDLDQSHGVTIGDLFSVITVGEKLIHPVTKKVIGTLEQAKGILKVTRIKSGYSYARPLTKEMDFKEGDPIRRYENLRAVFWDYTDQGRMFYGQLQSALPGLKWQDYDVAQRSKPKKPALVSNNGIDLYFILTPQQIEVRDVQFYRLHGYHSPKFISGAIPTIEKNETT
ncbi:MAG: hypothetical protein JSW04_09675, partial [Desulfobacterales bacterium]